MKIKAYLSWALSIISFTTIANFTTPLAYGDCYTDVSGTWNYKVVVNNTCCSDSSDDGQSIVKGSLEITQEEDKISGSWTDEDGYQYTLTGVVNADSVYIKVEGTISNDEGCSTVTYGVGVVKNKGKLIEGYMSGGDTGDCDTCRYDGKFKARIVN